MILSEIEQRIKAKIEKIGTPLKEWNVNIYRGILTGYNDAFIINKAKKEEILANCQSDEEREKMTELLAAGFTDTFRYLYPDAVDAYSWWSYMGKARERNVGWRIDYFLVSNSIADKIQEAKIHTDIFGSDHCPVELVIDL